MTVAATGSATAYGEDVSRGPMTPPGAAMVSTES